MCSYSSKMEMDLSTLISYKTGCGYGLTYENIKYCKHCGTNVLKKYYEEHIKSKSHTSKISKYGEDISDEDALDMKIKYFIKHLDILEYSTNLRKNRLNLLLTECYKTYYNMKVTLKSQKNKIETS